MDQGILLEIVGRSILTIILVASPILIVSMVVGLIVSIFQATTSIQDQTLTFVPKIISIFGSLIFFGPWMLNKLIEQTTYLLEYIGMVT